MTNQENKIPFSVEISRMIELLASQIYPTPFALLRENVQNSFDAILQRQYLQHDFVPEILITIEPYKIEVTDNGIGMTSADLVNHFWRAGSSSKNTDSARAAGVVGTFGIGAMANFGIAKELFVETESSQNGARTRCSAALATLSVTEDCIAFETLTSIGSPGTTITAIIQEGKSINVPEATKYISEFVAFLPINVYVNKIKVSGRPFEEAVQKLVSTWSIEKKSEDLGDGIIADIDLYGAVSGEVRLSLSNIYMGGKHISGSMILRQGIGGIKTYRSGFGLATTNVSSAYNFGGAANFLFLIPTAGREALSTESISVLQKIVSRVDQFVSLELSKHSECNQNSYFISWVARAKKYDLCSLLKIRVEPGSTSYTLGDIKMASIERPVLVYAGNDPATQKFATEERKLVVISTGSPRRDCEINYLRSFCKIEEMSTEPKVLRRVPEADMTFEMKAISFRLASILSQDYFLDCRISFGTISHQLPVIVQSVNPVDITLDPNGSAVLVLLKLYSDEFGAFGHMAKDFVRNMIFPRVKDLVPSSTRQGAEAFLKSVVRPREVFEYEVSDLESLASLWDDYLLGKKTMKEAAELASIRSVKSYQSYGVQATANVSDVLPDVVDNESITGSQSETNNFEPIPSIERLDLSTPSKLLIISDSEGSLRGYKCFLALSDKVREEKGDFFLQPHKTSIVWGGQKALFIFEHHSGRYGLYYDLQMQNILSQDSGGGSFGSCTIMMKNRIFIPIPPQIQGNFIPVNDEKKRFEVKCDILYID